MTTRRDILRGLGMGAAAAGVGVGLSRRANAAQDAHHAQTHTTLAPPWWLLAPLDVGTSVGKGWRVSQLTGIEKGASVLILANRDGREARVHICGRQGAARGPASTQHFDLVLMDGADGDLPTDEGLGRVLQGLARRVARNERRYTGDLGAVAQLMPHDERVFRFGGPQLV